MHRNQDLRKVKGKLVTTSSYYHFNKTNLIFFFFFFLNGVTAVSSPQDVCPCFMVTTATVTHGRHQLRQERRQRFNWQLPVSEKATWGLYNTVLLSVCLSCFQLSSFIALLSSFCISMFICLSRSTLCKISFMLPPTHLHSLTCCYLLRLANRLFKVGVPMVT